MKRVKFIGYLMPYEKRLFKTMLGLVYCEKYLIDYDSDGFDNGTYVKLTVRDMSKLTDEELCIVRCLYKSFSLRKEEES